MRGKYLFFYDDIHGGIKSVELILRTVNQEFNIPMFKNKYYFEVTKFLRKGQYMYKYLVEGILRLNDPKAECYIVDSAGEVWSFLCVSEGLEGKCNKSKINMNLKVKPLKKEYVYPIDRLIIYKVEVNECEGIHALTAIFYSGNGNVYQINEVVLSPCIQLKVNLKEGRCNVGVWKLDIYLDGCKYTSEYFRVSHRIACGTNIINVKL